MQKIHHNLKLKIRNIVKLNHDSVSLEIDLNNHDFNYYPGQYIVLKFDPLKETEDFKIIGNNKTFQRSYSLSSPPTQKQFISSVVKKMPNGFISDYINRIAGKNDEVYISGPFGKFYYNNERNIALIGAGSGISPLISILRYLNDKRLNYVKATLIYGNKTKEDIIHFKELNDIASNNSNIKIFYTLSREIPTDWNYFIGRIDSDMIKKCLTNLKNKTYFICGPTEMVDEVTNILKTLNVPKKNIKTEKYG